jgi:hypothetical protein
MPLSRMMQTDVRRRLKNAAPFGVGAANSQWTPWSSKSMPGGHRRGLRSDRRTWHVFPVCERRHDERQSDRCRAEQQRHPQRPHARTLQIDQLLAANLRSQSSRIAMNAPVRSSCRIPADARKGPADRRIASIFHDRLKDSLTLRERGDQIRSIRKGSAARRPGASEDRACRGGRTHLMRCPSQGRGRFPSNGGRQERHQQMKSS